MDFERGQYTIVHKGSRKAIGTIKGSGPRPLFGAIDETGDTVFYIEYAGTEPYRRSVHRITLDRAPVTIVGGRVVVDADIPISEASLWIIEAKREGGYGIIPGDLNRPIGALAWTMGSTNPLTPITLRAVTQTKMIPPSSFFKDDQLFDIIHVE